MLRTKTPLWNRLYFSRELPWIQTLSHPLCAQDDFSKKYSPAFLSKPSLDGVSLLCAYNTLHFLYCGLSRVRPSFAGWVQSSRLPSLPKTSETSCKFRGPQGYPTSDQMGTILHLPEDSFRFSNSLGRLMELTESVILNQPKEVTHRDKAGKVPNAKLPLSSGMCYLPGTSVCDNGQSITNQRSSPKHQCQSFHWGFIT